MIPAPAARPAAARPATARPAAARPAAAPLPSAAIIDDEAAFARVFAAMADVAGYQASGFASPEAFLALPEQPWGLIILDLNMPGTDGVQVLRRLAARSLRCPLVLVSGADPQLLRSFGAAAEAAGFPTVRTLSKPIRAEAMLALLRALRTDPAPAPSGARPALSPAQLREALAAGRLELHLQAKVDLRDGTIHGHEALARLRDAEGALVTPDRFLPAAEAGGLMGALFSAVWSGALAASGALRAAGLPAGIAVNLHPEGLGDVSLPDRLLEEARRAGCLPQDFTIELTERGTILDPYAGFDTLTRLRLLGFGLALDDFGTENATLRRIQQMPLTELKIDRSFITPLGSDPRAAPIVSSIINLAHQIGIPAVCEGLERPAQYAILRGLGCDIGQGYLFHRPQPLAAVLQAARRSVSLPPPPLSGPGCLAAGQPG